MNYFILFSILILPYTIFSYKLLYMNNEINENNEGLAKRSDSSESSDECPYVNSILQKEESFNCCNIKEIVCENGHITKM